MVLNLETNILPIQVNPGGVALISGTRIPIDSVIFCFHEGTSPEAIVHKFPSLALADVYAVISYYLNHKVAVDEYLVEHERVAEENIVRIQSDYDSAKLRQELLG